MHTTLHALDLIIIVTYLCVMAGVGVYFSRRQKNLETYFLAERNIAWLPIGLSLMAALNSGIDYLMQPSATIRYGVILLWGTVSWLFLYPWVAYVVFPFYHRLSLFTAYEYLEQRFDVRVRTLAAVIFMVWRLGWMATAMYVPALAINSATGGDIPLVPMIVVLGSVVTLYTMLGGIEAVIWNDVIQFCIMFGGLGATVGIVWANVPGGLAEIWHTAAAAGKTSLWTPLADPGATGFFETAHSFFAQPVTVVAMLSAMVVGRMSQYTSDQVMVQRLQSTRSIQDARQAFIVNAAGDALWMFGLSFVGLALFAYFQHHPLPAQHQTDTLLPYFMSVAFPVGAVGLVIAAILAASLSSIDSAINSCTSVAVVDIYKRLLEKPEAPASQSAQVRVSRMATVIFGVIGTTLACNVSKIGNLLEIVNKLVNSFSGPLFGIFVLAMFSERASSRGVLLGGSLGALATYYVAYHTDFSFLWPSTFGFAATLALGFAFSVMLPPESGKGATLTWASVLRR